MKLRKGRWYSHIQGWLAGLMLVGGLLLGGSLLSAQETEPTAVDLISFTVTQQFGSDELLIRWETAAEINTAGYRLERDETPISVDYEAPPDGNRTTVSIVPALGLTGNGSGGVYVAYDSGPFTQNATYEYTLIEIETDNVEFEIDLVEITIGSGPTATPENSSIGNNSTATPLPTNTPRATSTPVPTSPSSGQQTPTATPRTNSSNPTVTPSASNPTVTPAAVPPTNSSGPGQNESSENAPDPIAAVGVVEASENPQQDDPYPQPQPEDANESEEVGAPATSEDSYPVSAPETEPRFQPTDEDGNPVNQADPAYTPPDGASAIGTGSSVGEEAESAADQTVTQAQAGDGESQTALVWGAFIAALLIFGASVIGAIMLFSRRSQSAAPN